MEIWIVEQSSGSYEEYQSWPVGAFPTKEAAEEWVVVNQPIFLADLKKQEQEAADYEILSDRILEEHSFHWAPEDSPAQILYEKAVQELDMNWGDKATSHPYEEWGYSLNLNPIPYYG